MFKTAYKYFVLYRMKHGYLQECGPLTKREAEDFHDRMRLCQELRYISDVIEHNGTSVLAERA